MACNHGSSWLSPYKQPLALKREPLILRTKTVARVPGASAALDDDTKGHIWHRCVVKNTPEMWRYIALMLQTSMWMFHIWLAECFPLETSLEWREDVTADSGTAVSIRPKQARQRQRDSRWKQIPLEKNLVWGLSFPTWKHSGNCWHGPNHQTWDLGRDTERWQKELAPSVVTRTWKSCVSQSKDMVLENWFGVKVTIHSKMRIHSLTSHLYTQIVHRTFLGLHSKTELQHSPKQLT